jgi:predicted nucleic acid-binding protein
MAYLLDTGIVLRIVDRQDRQHDLVRRALGLLGNAEEELWVASQNVAEYLNVATRPVANNGLAMTSAVATELFRREIESIASILVEGDATHSEYLRLVETYNVTGKQVHDARLAAIMLTWQIENLLTLNDRHFRRFEPEGITIVTPADLVAGSSPAP